MNPVRLYLTVAALALASLVRLLLHPVPIPVLLFHDVQETRKDIDFWTLHPTRFRELLDLLDRTGYRGLSLAEIEAHLAGRLDRDRAANGVLITVDDGCASAATLVGPELAKRGHKAAFFVVTSWRPPQFVSAEQVAELRRAGHDIGSHSVTHASLNKGGERQIMSELVDSKTALGATAIAYPKGDWDETTKRLTRQAGYTMAFTTDTGYIAPEASAMELPRFQLNWDTPVDWIERYLTAPRDERRRNLMLVSAIALLALFAAVLNRRAHASSCHTEKKEMA